MMLLSLCKEYWQIMLVQGVLMGITQGLLQFPAFAAVFQHFDKHRAAALGIVVAGSTLGGIVIPIATSKMLNDSSLGFGWSIRIIGFLILPFIAFALMTVKARLPSRKTAFWPSASIFRNPRFALLSLSIFFTFIGMFTPFFYLPSYAVTRGMDATLAGYLSAILNGASTFGRVIPGLLADKYGRINMYAFGTLVTGVIIFCMNSATSTAALVIYSVAFGFWSGTIISGSTASVSLCVDDPRDTGKVMGVYLFIGALGGLLGPPVNGVMVKHYGGFFEASMFSGTVCLLGGVVALATKMFTEPGIFGRV
jgi:MFS family permease